MSGGKIAPHIPKHAETVSGGIDTTAWLYGLLAPEDVMRSARFPELYQLTSDPPLSLSSKLHEKLFQVPKAAD